MRSRSALSFFVAAGLLAALSCAPTDPPPAPEPEPAPEVSDALAPKTTDADAVTKQLHTTTLCTADLDRIKAFYGDGFGLQISGPIELTPEVRKTQRALWGIPEDIGWELYIMDRPAVPGTIQVRVLLLDRETPNIHTTWDPQEPGPFSMGFPTEDLETWDPELRAKGWESLMPMSSYQIPRPDGTTYGIQETIFNAPDFMHAVTISRRDGMPQLGPVDPATGRGGPIYSAHIIENSDAVLEFYVGVLGLELRSDRQFKSSGSKGALGVPDGTEFRFSIVYAHGATFGHLLFLDYQGRLGLPSPGVEWRPPNRGMAMWSFPVRDMDETLTRLEAAGIEPFAPMVEYSSPSLGHHKSVTVLDPSGFMVELFQTVD
ncbi:MAG: VOC family protein [Thermoanaerobaculales bacterium]|jgi:catechol 2,3-dioxygenase-like lactoylglutathione lyase family enzyme|nr:VOC family protein [Thermoanaerobaculales bacterium]